MRTLRDLLVCPRCRGDLRDTDTGLACPPCAVTYPVVRGVPVLLPEVTEASLVPRFEANLPPRPGYSQWKERLLIKATPRSAAVLDFGCGYQALDDPNIIRMDACLHPYADLVGDVHHLPLRDGSISLAFGGAVFEHLHDPWQAAAELARVLCPGGFVYADWNFVFAYHGYPSHYFNASRSGVAEVFGRVFDIVELGVAPFQGPGAALRQVIGTYLEHLAPRDHETMALRDDLETLLLRPLEQLDRAIPSEQRHRTAAGIYVLATRPGRSPEALISDAAWARWEQDADLRAALPDPRRLADPGSLVQRLGASLPPEDGSRLFSKDGSGRQRDEAIDGWPDALLTEPEPPANAELRRVLLARRRPLLRKFKDALASPADVARLPGRVWRWLRWRVQHARGLTP